MEKDARLATARRHAEARRFVEAERLLEEFLLEQPRSLTGWDLLGYVQYFAGRPADAERACRKALCIEPAHAYAKKGLGLCLAAQGNLELGLAELREAIALEPRWFDPRHDLCVTLLAAHRFEEAHAVVREALAVLPFHQGRLERLEAEINQKQSAYKSRDGA